MVESDKTKDTGGEIVKQINEDIKLFIPTENVFFTAENEEKAIEAQKRLYEEQGINTWIIYNN